MGEKLKQGVWAVVATPFDADGSTIDLESLARTVRHQERIGVAGLTALGVFGEASSLTAIERRAVLETIAESTELPLVVGVTSLATAPAIAESLAALDVLGTRMAGAMVQVNSPDPDVVARHLGAIHSATGLGIVAQDYPVASGVVISAENLGAAVSAVPGVIAVKAEAPPTAIAIASLTARLGVPVFGGLGGVGLIDELASGAAGAMTGFSYTEGLIDIVQAWAVGGLAGARKAAMPYLPLMNFEQQAGIALAVRKRCLVERGLFAHATVRAPARVLPQALEQQVVDHVALMEDSLSRS